MDDTREPINANSDAASRPEDDLYAQSNLWKVVIIFAILLLILIVGAVKYLMR